MKFVLIGIGIGAGAQLFQAFYILSVTNIIKAIKKVKTYAVHK